MNLATYLKKEGISQKSFADSIKASDGTVSLLIAGKTWLSRGLARRISKATNGDVTATDFVEDGCSVDLPL